MMSTDVTDSSIALSVCDAPSVGYSDAMCDVIATRVADLERECPITPQKSQLDPPCTPITPTANLKVLVAAAAKVAIDNDSKSQDVKLQLLSVENEGADSEGGGVCEDDLSGRKTKSLAILCKKFLSIAESEVGVGSEFSLESMATSLGTNRRRIYDIINVLESLEMIVKQSKNWYMWLGRDGLLATLAKLKAMARDDTEFRQLYDAESSNKENTPVHSPCVGVGDVSVESGWCEDGGSGSRWDKSLGVLCQKFVMLFLVTPNNEVTLDCAGSILMPDNSDSTPAAPANPKTKVRRLYDIANVLTTLGLIRKKTFLAPNHRKMPGYSWCGPPQEEIDSITVSRKSEFTLAPLFPNKKQPTPTLSGMSLSRRLSFGKNRPFLHQYEVKGQPDVATHSQPSSAPTTPVKAKGGGFKRSLSFGGGVNPRKAQIARGGDGNCVGERMEPIPVTKVNPKYWTYLSEIREFEAEMLKQADKYPHVVPLFRDFIQRYISCLESTHSTSRTILPKPTTPTLTRAEPPQKLPPNGRVPIPPLSMDPAHRTPNYTSPLARTNTASEQQAPLTLSKLSTEMPQLTRPLQTPPDLIALQASARPSKTPPELLAMQGFARPSYSPPELLAMQAHPSSIGYGAEPIPTTLMLPQNVKVGDLLNRVGSVASSPLSQATVSEQKKPPPQLECFEVLNTDGYQRRQSAPPSCTLAPPKSTPIDPPQLPLTSASLNTLVNQKPIPSAIEGVPIQPKPIVGESKAPVSSATPSALLAGQIVSYLQCNPALANAAQLLSLLPPSVIPHLFSLPVANQQITLQLNSQASAQTLPLLSSGVAHQTSTSIKTLLTPKTQAGVQTRPNRNPLSELNGVKTKAGTAKATRGSHLTVLQENNPPGQSRKLIGLRAKNFDSDKESPPKRVRLSHDPQSLC